jgi:hypothetical protein
VIKVSFIFVLSFAEHSEKPCILYLLMNSFALSFDTTLFKSHLFPIKCTTISSLVAFLIDSYQKSKVSKEFSEVTSYTKKAPSAFLIWLVVIALYRSAPAI